MKRQNLRFPIIEPARYLSFALVWASLAFISSTAHAEVVSVSQLRDVTTFALISEPSSPPDSFCSEELGTTEPGAFADTVTCEVADAGNSAMGTAAQLSYISPDQIYAEGSIRANADISGGADFAEGLGGSRFVSAFSVDEPTEVHLQTLLYAGGNGVANLVFRIENEEILIYRSIFESSLEVDEWLVLEPGTYELTFTTSGYGQALPDGSGLPAVGRFSGSLEFTASDAGESEPHPTSALRGPMAIPNPVHESTMLFPAHGVVAPDSDIVILSLDGRVIRHFANVGPGGVEWNATDDRGRPVGAGVFVMRSTRHGASKRLVVLQ